MIGNALLARGLQVAKGAEGEDLFVLWLTDPSASYSSELFVSGSCRESIPRPSGNPTD
jgi:hypothetical protein